MNTHLQKHRRILGIIAAVSLVAGSGAYKVAATANWSGPSPEAGPGVATIAVIAPNDAQPGGVPFEFTSSLMALSVTAGAPAWAGYDFELAYDNSIIEIDSAEPALCAPKNVWANPALAPRVSTGCIGMHGTSTGVLETFTAQCIGQGTSPLHIVPADERDAGTVLFDDAARPVFALTLVDGSVACAGASAPLSPATLPASARHAKIGGTPLPGAVTLSMIAPAGAQPIGRTFEITSNISALTLTDDEPAWAGYDFEMAYDPTILTIQGVAPNLCQPAGVWGNPLVEPYVETGCFAQDQQSAGTLETMTAVCLRAGTSPLHIVPDHAPEARAIGTELFDEYARSAFVMTLQDGSVTCGGE